MYDILDRNVFPPIEEEQNDKTRKFMTFHNKGMDIINQHRILHNKTLTSKIPEYFVYKEPPELCYRYISAISRHINHQQTCKEFDQSTGNTNFSCECESYPNSFIIGGSYSDG